MSFMIDIMNKANFLTKVAIGSSFLLHLFLPRNDTYFVMDIPGIDLLPFEYNDEYGNKSIMTKKERPRFEIRRTDIIIAGTIAAMWIGKRRYSL